MYSIAEAFRGVIWALLRGMTRALDLGSSMFEPIFDDFGVVVLVDVQRLCIPTQASMAYTITEFDS